MKIRYKLFFAILATAFVSVFALQQAQRYSFESGLKRYSQSSRLERLEPLILGLTDIYIAENSWESLRGGARLPIPDILIRSEERPNEHRHPSNQFDDRQGFRGPPRLFAGLALLDESKKHIVGAIDIPERVLKPINHNGVLIGYLAVPSDSRVTRQIDRRFAEQQQTGRIWAVIVILIGALLFAYLISRSLGRPIKNLVEQVHKLYDGHYNVTFVGENSDEFGSLSNKLNSLAARLRDNRLNRQQWISDISHELRTPVAVLQAEIECIEDKHKPLDMEAVSSLKSEVIRLSYLIDDLHQLSQADSGAMSFDFSMCDIASEVGNAVTAADERFLEKNISVDVELNDLPLVYGDVFRLRQVMNNLFENTLRYTDSPGRFRISWRQLEGAIELLFEDSAPAVPEASLAKLFDRLYRVDPSRNRATGASGLGLSICHSIIKAHGGVIAAEKSSLGGLAIRFSLPTNDQWV
jgi:two-component system sensor histidine kinase BaeS